MELNEESFELSSEASGLHDFLQIKKKSTQRNEFIGL